MKKIIALFLAVLTIFGLSTLCFALPKGAVLIDGKNGRVFFEAEKDKKLPMASTTKIMTALIVLEEENLDEFFTVNSTAIKVEGSSMGLMEGDKVTLRALAAGMLLASGNDAANAAAVKISGSTEEFVKLMNQRAKEMGLESTSFETPSGLDGENHFSTAYDMAMLAKNALSNPDFAALCGAVTAKAEYGNPPYLRNLTNHNRLLKTFEGATGVKTGFTKKAGRCLVSSAEREGVQLICVTLGCSDDWNYHAALYNEYFEKLSAVPLEGKISETEVLVTGGDSLSVKLKALPVEAALFSGEESKLKIEISVPPFIFAPVEKGKVLGKATFYIGTEEVAQTSLVAAETVEKAFEKQSIFDRIKD